MLHLLPGIIEFWWPFVACVAVLIFISDRWGWVAADHAYILAIVCVAIWNVANDRYWLLLVDALMIRWAIRGIPKSAERDRVRREWRARRAN